MILSEELRRWGGVEALPFEKRMRWGAFRDLMNE
jgi:hypothetical protein